MDYAQLKLDDPGGTVENAYTVLSAMTNTIQRDKNRINLRDIYTACGSADGEAVISALEAAATKNPVVARALKWAAPGSDMGIDIVDAEVQSVFNSLVGIAGVTQPMIDKVIALKDTQEPKYPGLKSAHIEYARSI